MTTALTRYDGPTTLEQRVDYSLKLSASTLLPGLFRGREANVFYGVEYARMVDIPVLAAITGIHVIDGKPTASAGLMTALVRRAGHKFRIRIEGTFAAGDLAAVATLIRSDDPDEPFVSRWDVDRAIRAKLLKRNADGTVSATKSGSAWDTYLEAMLKARATSEVCREGAEEALYGIRYTAEELGADVDADGEPLEGTVIDPPPRPPAGPAAAPATQQEEDLVVEEVKDEPGQPQEAPTPPPAGPAPQAPAEPAQDAPTPNVDAVRQLARTIAERALESADVEKVRKTYKELGPLSERAGMDVGKVDVLGYLGDDDTAALGLDPDLTELALGALLMAVGGYITRHGTAVRDLDPDLDGDGSAEDTPAVSVEDPPADDPWEHDNLGARRSA